jgi:uncharacterized OsmC-like protein
MDRQGGRMSEQFEVSLTRLDKFQFLVAFDKEGIPVLITDEAVPVGEGKGPNPARLLAAAVGNCLAASLLFCLNKAHVDVLDLKCSVEGEIERNDKGRMRISELRVKIQPGIAREDLDRIGRCVDIFEDFCIVTESVRSGIDVLVELVPEVAEVAVGT